VDDMVYTIADADQIIRTQNYFLVMDDNFDVRECCKMSDLSVGYPRHPFPVEGFEDCRLFFCKGQFWCTCTVRDRNPSGRCEIAVLRLDDNRNVAEMHVVRSFRRDLHQKNWMPLVWNDDLYLIYSTDPTVVLKYDFASGNVEIYQSSVPGPCLEMFRGGSQAVRVADGWICLVHESQQMDERARFYQHRFVLLSEEFRVKGFTEPFYFLRKGIEFCAGLGHDRDSGRFVASFGVNDQEGYLAFFDQDSVYSRLVSGCN
jgi:hypothetical protein